MSEKVKISIAGTGFVGLITAAVFADRNFSVTAIDIDENKIEAVNKGKAFFFEPNLDTLLDRVVKTKKNLKATSNVKEAILASDISFICVGTPELEDGSCDLKYIKKVSEDIGKAIGEKEAYHLVVVKSTVVPETTRKIVKPILEQSSGKTAGKDFGLCMSPEFLREGQSVFDTLFPDRIIIGEYDKKSGDLLASTFQILYSSEPDDFTENCFKLYNRQISCPEIKRHPLETAECIKYANNTFLATKISFINEFANICERIKGVDVKDIAEGIGLDFRINANFLRAGAGFGGSCFPKDVNAIIHFAKSKNYNPAILNSVLAVNNHQAKRMVELTEEKLGSLEKKAITILGLSFKPDTDDMRNAPSIKIIDYLLEKNAIITAWDPQAVEVAKKEIGDKITYAKSLEAAIKDAEACLLVTEWKVFKGLVPADFKAMKNPLIIDGRRIYESKVFLENGVEYTGIGLG